MGSSRATMATIATTLLLLCSLNLTQASLRGTDDGSSMENRPRRLEDASLQEIFHKIEGRTRECDWDGEDKQGIAADQQS